MVVVVAVVCVCRRVKHHCQRLDFAVGAFTSWWVWLVGMLTFCVGELTCQRLGLLVITVTDRVHRAATDCLQSADPASQSSGPSPRRSSPSPPSLFPVGSQITVYTSTFAQPTKLQLVTCVTESACLLSKDLLSGGRGKDQTRPLVVSK